MSNSSDSDKTGAEEPLRDIKVSMTPLPSKEVELTEAEKKLPKSEREGEFGAVGKITDMVLHIQNEVLDIRDISLEQIIFMTRNDGNARGLLNAIKYPLKMSRPEIKAPEKGGKKETEFIRMNLLNPAGEGGMSTPMRAVVSRMALGVRDGYKIFEKVWKMRKGKIHLDKLAYRSTLDTKFKYDKHGGINGAEQDFTDLSTGMWKHIDYPLEKIAYFIFNVEENPYKGESAFYAPFYHYDKKHKLYAISHLAYQLSAVPVRVGYHPKSLRGDDLTKFRAALSAIGTSIAITVPENCKVEPFESSRSLTDFLYLIQHHDTAMRMAFLAQFMGLGQEGGGGSYALSADQSNLFLMSIMGLLEDIAEVFNTQIIPQLIDWNFGTGKYPVLSFTPFSDTLRSAVMTTFQGLLQARFPQASEDFILKLEQMVATELGMGLDYEEIKKKKEEERKALEAAAKEAITDEGVSNASEPTKEKAGITPASKTKKGEEKNSEL